MWVGMRDLLKKIMQVHEKNIFLSVKKPTELSRVAQPSLCFKAMAEIFSEAYNTAGK